MHSCNIYMHVTHKNLLQWISAFEVQKLAFTENTVLIFYKKKHG